MSLICKMTCAIALFIFGISLLGDGLSSAAGGRMEWALQRMTDTRLRGFLTGTVVTAVVQSSTAVSVLTAELTQSGILTLRRTIPVLIGANVGTTATAWLLYAMRDLPKALFFSSLLAAVGIILYLIPSRRHWGSVLLGLFLLLSGMEAVTAAAQPLTQTALVHRCFTAAGQPLWGMLGGILLTVLMQSSSVSVGLLQALSFSGQVSYAMAIPVVLGQNVGTCLTVFLVAAGGKQRAGQAAWAHLLFNVIGSGVMLCLLLLVKWLGLGEILTQPADCMGIAVIHTVFNLTGAVIFLPLNEPFASLIEYLTVRPQSVSASR